MPRHMEAYLNGVALTDAAPLALIQQVREEPEEVALTTAENALGDGQLLLERRRTRLTVAIEFAMREAFDLSRRAREQQQAASWAQDGLLRLSNRPDQQLRVVCTRRPSLGEDRNYTQVLRAEFTAIAPPYWQDQAYTQVSGSGASGSLTLRPAGTVALVPLEAEITPTGGTLNSLTITCAGTSMAFTGLNVASGTVLIIGLDARFRLSVTAGGAGKLSCRTAQSSDRLLAVPMQNNAVTWTANTACDCTFKARGLYL